MGDTAEPASEDDTHSASESARPLSLRADTIGLLITASLVIAIYLLSFGSVLFTDDVLRLAGRGDFHGLNSPKAYFLDVRLQQGEFPLWDPLTLAGMPYAAHPLAMAFYPPNLVRALVARPATPVDFLRSLYLFVLFHMLVTASGVYLLARREGISRATGIVIAVALPFSERWVANALTQMPMVCTIAWMPFVLFALRACADAQSARRRSGWAVAAGVIYGMQILAGWPQAAINMTFLYVIYFVLRVGIREFSGPTSIRHIAGTFVSAAWRGALFGMVGGLTGSALMLPASELMSHSARSSANFSKFTEVAGLFVYLRSRDGLAWARDRFEPGLSGLIEMISFEFDHWFSLNLALLVIAVSSLLFIAQFRVFVYLVLTFLAFDLTFGPPLPLGWILERFAPFTLSTPFYTSMLVAFPLVMLAGFALDGLIRWGKRGHLPWFATLILCAAGGGIVAVFAEPPSDYIEKGVAWSTLPAIVLLLVVFGQRLRFWPQLVMGALVLETALCAVPIVDRFVARSSGGRTMHGYPSDTEILRRHPNPELRRARVICENCNHHVWALEPAINGYEPLALYASFEPLADPGEESTYRRHRGVTRNLRALTLLKRSFWLAPSFVRGLPPADKSRLYPPTAAVFVDTAEALDLPEVQFDQLPHSTIDRPSGEYPIWPSASQGRMWSSRNDQVIALTGVRMPTRNHAMRIYYQSPVFATVSARFQGSANGVQHFRVDDVALSPTADPASFVELPMPDFALADVHMTVHSAEGLPAEVFSRVTLVEDEADEAGRVEIRESSANQAVIRLQELPGPRALVFTEMNYPGWSATLDGTAVPIHAANGPFMAVVVPAGSHEVVFRFRPWRVYLGVGISLATVCLAGIALVFCFFRRQDCAADTEWSRLSER